MEEKKRLTKILVGTLLDIGLFQPQEGDCGIALTLFFWKLGLEETSKELYPRANCGIYRAETTGSAATVSLLFT
jgi:hypothetical protein